MSAAGNHAPTKDSWMKRGRRDSSVFDVRQGFIRHLHTTVILLGPVLTTIFTTLIAAAVAVGIVASLDLLLKGEIDGTDLIIGGIVAFILTPIVAIAFIRLIDELERGGFKLKSMATTDPLTDAANRRHLEELITNELERTRTRDVPMSLLMLDLDHFKNVNDTHGHQVGDRVLRAVARRARGTLRRYDQLGRYGGEEFVAVLPETDLQHALYVAERIRSAVAASRIHAVGAAVHMTVSIGVTEYRPGDTRDEILSRADEALYVAKRRGRNRVEVVTERRSGAVLSFPGTPSQEA